MSTTQTFRESRRLRSNAVPVPQGVVGSDEPETGLEWFRRWSCDMAERRRRAGLPEDDPMTMEEIVAICKEARAERYAEEQEQKNACYGRV